MASFEIVVIGAGVEGSSIAYHLARLGRKVLMLERSEPAVEPAASWASAGGVRRQGRHPAEAKLAIESIERWPALEEELGADMGYRQGGNLYVGEGQEAPEQIRAFVQCQRDNGFGDVRYVDRKEALEIVPHLNDQVTAASYSPSDGQADPALTTCAFAAAAQRHGATVWTETAGESLLTRGDRVVGVRTTRGDVEAEQVVLAAGAWSDDLAATVGLRLPMRTRVPQILISSPAPPNTLIPVLGSLNRRLSLKQTRSGEFMLGGGWPGEYSDDRRSYRMRQASIEGGWAAGAGLLPPVGQQKIVRQWCGLEAQAFDDVPFIGSAPGVGGLTLACGFSGHGFAIAPGVGRAVADQLAGRPTPELAGLDPSRVTSFDPAAVEQFINDRSEASLGVG